MCSNPVLRKNPNVDKTINQAKDVFGTTWQNNNARLQDLTNALTNFWKSDSDDGSDEVTDAATRKPAYSTYEPQIHQE